MLRYVGFVALIVAPALPGAEQGFLVHPGDRVLFLGDSIT
jgi:hypothetical protein